MKASCGIPTPKIRRMPEFDRHEDPIPLAKRAIESRGDITDAEVVFLANALIFAYNKVDQLYSYIEKGPKGPQKLCDVLNAATEWRDTRTPESTKTLLEAIAAAWRNDAD